MYMLQYSKKYIKLFLIIYIDVTLDFRIFIINTY